LTFGCPSYESTAVKYVAQHTLVQKVLTRLLPVYEYITL